MTITFEEKVELIGKYKDKNEKFELVYKYGKNIDSPKLNDEQKEKARKNVEVAYNAIKQIEDNKAKKTATAKSGAKKKTMLGLASEIKKRDNVTWAEAKKRAKSEYESDKKKAVNEEKQQIADFKKQVGKIKFTRATTKTDIKKDKVLPALPSGKRYPKRGTTTNKYGTYKNDPKKPYWENRANRMDVNQPSKSVYPKLADGGVIGSGKNGYVAFYKGKRIEVYADTMYGAQKTAAKHFNAKKEWEVNVNLAEVDGKPYMQSTAFVKGGKIEDITPALNQKIFKRAEEIYIKQNGKTKSDFDKSFDKAIIEFGFKPSEYHAEMEEIGAQYDDAQFAKGGEVKLDNRFEFIKDIGEYKIYYNKSAKNYAIVWKSRFAPAFETMEDVENYISKKKMEFAEGGKFNDNLYVDQLASMSGARAVAVKEFASANNLSKDDLLNIIQGLGRKQITASQFVNAVLGDKTATSEVVSYAKNGKGFKMGDGGDISNAKNKKIMEEYRVEVSDLRNQSYPKMSPSLAFKKASEYMLFRYSKEELMEAIKSDKQIEMFGMEKTWLNALKKAKKPSKMANGGTTKRIKRMGC